MPRKVSSNSGDILRDFRNPFQMSFNVLFAEILFDGEHHEVGGTGYFFLSV